MADQPTTHRTARFGIPSSVKAALRRRRRLMPLWYVGPLETDEAAMGNGGPCMSCGGNDGYGPAPHHKPNCYFASTEDANG